MDNKVILTHAMVDSMVGGLNNRISKEFHPLDVQMSRKALKVYPIPRGGIPVAYALQKYREIKIVDNPEEADIFVDDIYDSGATCRRYCDEYPERMFYVLIDKSLAENNPLKNKWIVFPWEQNEGKDGSVTDNVTRMLQYIGEDPNREGLLETPDRVVKAYDHWFSGYKVNIAALLKVFEDGASGYDEMVVVRDIPIYSKCEHHLADIFGTATIAYIPDGRIVGLSKLSRVADAFARRLQVQERLTGQIANALDMCLKPKGVGVIIKARHMCMESRGICQQGHHTITSALRGVIKTDPNARAEFLNLAK